MLYQIGPVTLDTRPFNADEFSRKAGADIAKKATIGGLKPKEFMGVGDETISLSGQLLPFKTGGLTELNIVDNFRKNGSSLPVMRGDGSSLGWYMIESITEKHKELNRNGVGFIVTYTIKLTKTEPGGGALGIIEAILEIFGVAGF